ncbi:TetR/AcrR family transcriptional regulator [Intrasporangium sp. YIM S08009]|uniref:TetR/AcrR family transcriptional regulator n=1 Tax=Intrasporangium zincisolvens TaxID=3080018 RepID=UPI002B05D75C|nr:TetR/AcrR family transcriptional regulator [Intrasporangium sp. YIM S08009]
MTDAPMPPAPDRAAPPSRAPGRDRLLEAASRLFYREGINGVGVDRILAEAGVTRATMYRHFTGKEALVAAYLQSEDETIRGYFTAAEATGGPPRELLGRVVDAVADDVSRYHTRGCPFINAAAEFPDAASPVRQIVTAHRAWFRQTLTDLARAAGSPDPGATAAALVLLRDAALVGGYLDGVDVTAPAFVATARRVAGLDVSA